MVATSNHSLSYEKTMKMIFVFVKKNVAPSKGFMQIKVLTFMLCGN